MPEAPFANINIFLFTDDLFVDNLLHFEKHYILHQRWSNKLILKEQYL